MKSFAILLACLAALVSMQARKTKHARKAVHPTEEQTVEDILSDVPDPAAESNTDYQFSYKDVPAASPKDFDPTAAFNEDVSVTPFQGPSGAQDVSIQPSSGMSEQGTAFTTLEGLDSPMEESRSKAAPTPDPSLPIGMMSLHEDTMGKAIDTKKRQTSTKSKQELSSELENIESTVLHLADKVKKTGKADDALLNMTADINKLLDESIIADLIIQYQMRVASVSEAIAKVTSCTEGPDNHYDPNISISNYPADQYDHQHYECRQAEMTSMDMEDKWGRSCDAHKDRCTSLNESWYQDGGYNIVDWTECEVPHTQYHGSLWLNDYYLDQKAYWSTLWGELNTTWSYVEGNCSLWEECEANLTKAKLTTKAYAAQCDQLQAKMDSAYCHYKEDIDNQWDLYTNCCQTTSGICPVMREKAINDMAWLDKQYVATERIKCYMHAFPLPNLAAELQKCRDEVVDTTYQGPLPYWDQQPTATGSMPARVYPPVPTNSIKPFPPCPTCPQSPHECTLKTEGENTSDYRYDSMDNIPGTPAYQTVHYRPPPVKHLVTECQASCCPNKCR